MKNSKAVLSEIVSALRVGETLSEKEAVAMALLENIFGLSRTEVYLDAAVSWSDETALIMQAGIDRVNAGEPVQYVTEEAYFYGRRFFVNNAVLIPRPETEELVELVARFLSESGFDIPHVIDIGTGSGCIAITVSLSSAAKVIATDISEGALAVATTNASRLGANVAFLRHDILREELPLRKFDVVVSNPPYICLSESDTMEDNVKLFEPHNALFVPDDDPLLFYRVIARKSFGRLNAGGMIAVETNERFAHDVAALFNDAGFVATQVVRDLSGKDRFVTALQPKA